MFKRLYHYDMDILIGLIFVVALLCATVFFITTATSTSAEPVAPPDLVLEYDARLERLEVGQTMIVIGQCNLLNFAYTVTGSPTVELQDCYEAFQSALDQVLSGDAEFPLALR